MPSKYSTLPTILLELDVHVCLHPGHITLFQLAISPTTVIVSQCLATPKACTTGKCHVIIHSHCYFELEYFLSFLHYRLQLTLVFTCFPNFKL